MNLRYKINDSVYYYDNESLEVFKIKSITMDELGVIYNITNKEKQLIAKEDELFTELTDVVSENYILYPVSIKSPEKCGRSFNLYESYYDIVLVYKIKSADIGILRPVEHQYPSYVDYECNLVGKISTNILKNNHITIPRVVDIDFFKIDANQHNQMILEFNKSKSKLLNFVEICSENTKTSHRLPYQKCMDDFILGINPKIKEVVQSIDDVISLETSYSDYVVTGDKIVSRIPLTPNIEINYLEVGPVIVSIELLNVYRQDSIVLPDLYVYRIKDINITPSQISKIINSRLLLEYEDIKLHGKTYGFEMSIEHKINLLNV